MLDSHPIFVVLEAAGSQLIALLFRIVVDGFFSLVQVFLRKFPTQPVLLLFLVLLDIQLHYTLVHLSCYHFTAVSLIICL